jgi:hypothetical protein
MLQQNIHICNLISGPISTAEIHQAYTEKIFTNHLNDVPPQWSNYQSLNAKLLNHNDTYTFTKSEILNEITDFLKSNTPNDQAPN